MVAKAFVSRLRNQLDARGLTVAELQRRLRERGVKVSRSALDRMVSDDPIDVVHLSILMPILDELDLDLSSVFVPANLPKALVDAPDSLATPSVTRPASEETRLEEANNVAASNTALGDSIQRFLAVLREENPDLYASVVDPHGRVRREALTKILRGQLGEYRIGTGSDFISITKAGLLNRRLPSGA